MKYLKQISILVILSLFFVKSFSQSLLVVEKRYSEAKNLKYKIDDRISLKMNNNDKIDGLINKMSDTTITLNNITVNLSDINTIYTHRKLLSVLSEVGIKAGLAFVAVDSFNNLINNDTPFFKSQTLKIGGIMLAAGIIINPFVLKKHRIQNDKWRMRVLKFYDIEGN